MNETSLLYSSYTVDSSKPKSAVDRLVGALHADHFTNVGMDSSTNSVFGFERITDFKKERAKEQVQNMKTIQDSDPSRFGFPLLQESLGNKSYDMFREFIPVPINPRPILQNLPGKTAV